MRSFLGVPIVFKGDVIAAFYLTDKTEGPGFTEGAGFTEADEQLVGVLAAHAAVLIEHARLYEGSRELSVLDERNRLARDLHDAITQSLFSLRLTIEMTAPQDDTPGRRIMPGRLLTVDTIIRTAAEKAELRQRFQADVVDMESSAVAALCAESSPAPTLPRLSSPADPSPSQE